MEEKIATGRKNKAPFSYLFFNSGKIIYIIYLQKQIKNY